jgi:hypothetical protein
MKVIIAGSRTITDYALLMQAVVQSEFEITTVVSGMARGVDSLGITYAELHRLPLWQYPADWSRYGRAAGIQRNKKMAMVADALIAVWDGQSRGTKNMIDEATRKGLRVFVLRVPSVLIS